MLLSIWNRLNAVAKVGEAGSRVAEVPPPAELDAADKEEYIKELIREHANTKKNAFFTCEMKVEKQLNAGIYFIFIHRKLGPTN